MPRIAPAAGGAPARPIVLQDPSPTPRDAPDPDEVLRQFRIIFRSIKRHFQAIERECGISGSQLWALSVVTGEAGIRVTGLARQMSIHQSTASNLVESLVRRGLVERRRSNGDQRVVELHATRVGKAAVRKAPQPLEGLLPDALRKLRPETLATLHGHLDELLSTMKARDRAAAFVPLADL
jgi:DNA-binding MarR family transcriptional regulator